VPSTVAPRASEQASQPPVQAVSQQAPSAQEPEAHWFAAVQAAPFTLLDAHTPLLQKAPALQSASPAQEARHAAEVPLQCVRLHSDAGSVRAGYPEQAPTLPDRSQAWHVPSHALLQQAPSTQKPEAHALAAPQLAAFAFFAAQAPPSQ